MLHSFIASTSYKLKTPSLLYNFKHKTPVYVLHQYSGFSLLVVVGGFFYIWKKNPLPQYTIFVLTSYSFLDTQVMQILILIDDQYSQKAVFCFEKGQDCQNHSSSGSHHPVKKSPCIISDSTSLGVPLPQFLLFIWKTLILGGVKVYDGSFFQSTVSLGYSRKKTNGRLWIWNFQGYQRNGMWNFHKLIKMKQSFQARPRKNHAEFRGVFTFGIGISMGYNTILWNFEG